MLVKTETVGENNAQLTCYIQAPSPEMRNAACRPGVLVLPGGAYRGCADREAEPVALAYVAHGFNAFVLRYTTSFRPDTFNHAYHDAQAALAYLHAEADALHLDARRIAAVGFSAGGHLAACLGTMSSCKPAALVLCYPVILEKQGIPINKKLPGVDVAVTGETPPTFLFASQGDRLVPVENALAFALALARAKVPFEQHVFLTGDHSLSLGIPATSAGKKAFVNSDAAEWLPMSVRFLENLWGGFEIYPDFQMPAEVNSPVLNCFLGELMQNEAVLAVLRKHVPALLQEVKDYPFTASQRLVALAERVEALRDMAVLRELETAQAHVH